MATEQYTTLGQSTLNGAINNSTTTVVLTSAASFPAAGNFRIRVENEIMKVTGVSSNTLTVVRAQEGTSAASHADTTAVTEVLTASAIDAIRADICQAGALSSLPANEKAGILYIPTGNYDRAVARDTGAAWQRVAAAKYNFQPLSGLAWVTQGTASADDNGNMLTLSSPAEDFSGSAKVRILKKSLTLVGGACTFTVQYYPTQFQATYTRSGIIMRESSTGKFYWHLLYGANAVNDWAVEYWTDEGTFSSRPVETNNAMMTAMHSFGLWRRIVYDGTNIKSYISGDGKVWYLTHSVAKTTPFTSAPNEIGIAILAANATYPVAMSVQQWIEE